MNREAQILQALQGNLASEAKRALVAELNTIRSQASRRVAVAREVELGKEAAAAHLTPAQPHVRHTSDTDWLGRVASTRHTATEIHQMAKSAAASWFRQTSPLARADAAELNIQAVGYANLWAGSYGDLAPMASSSFLQAASHLAGVKFAAEDDDPEEDQDDPEESYEEADDDDDTDDGGNPFADDDSKKEGRRTARRVTARSLSEIAVEIENDWVNVNYGAKPYLDAMFDLNSITDNYYEDSAKSIVAYFLSNAGSWKGETAKRIKAELKAMMSGKGASLHTAADGQMSFCRLCGKQLQQMENIWYALRTSPEQRSVGEHYCVPARISGRPGEFGPDGLLVPGTPGGEGGQYDAPAGTIFDAGGNPIKVGSRKTASRINWGYTNDGINGRSSDDRFGFNVHQVGGVWTLDVYDDAANGGDTPIDSIVCFNEDDGKDLAQEIANRYDGGSARYSSRKVAEWSGEKCNRCGGNNASGSDRCAHCNASIDPATKHKTAISADEAFARVQHWCDANGCVMKDFPDDLIEFVADTGQFDYLNDYLDDPTSWGGFESFSSLRTAGEGMTCSVCGDAMTSTDGSYHHNNGTKHDHEAKPGKESSRQDGIPPGYMSPEDWDRFYNGDGVSDGVPKDIFPGGGVPLHGDLTPEQEAWMKSRKRSTLITAAEAYDWRNWVGHAYMGFPGSEIVSISPSTDYLMNGPRGTGPGHQAPATMVLRTEDGRELTIPIDLATAHRQVIGARRTASENCSRCGGSGAVNWPSSEGSGTMDCPKCKGTGQVGSNKESRRTTAEADGIDSPSPDSQNGYAESTLPDVSVPSAPEDTNMGWIAEGDPNAVTAMGHFEAMFMGKKAGLYPDENAAGVTTWADGSGNWHATADSPEEARKAIERELADRGDIDPQNYEVEVKLVDGRHYVEATRKQAEANGIDSPSPQSQNGYAETTLTDVSVGSAPDDTNLGWIADGDPNAEDEASFEAPDNPIANEAAYQPTGVDVSANGQTYYNVSPEDIEKIYEHYRQTDPSVRVTKVRGSINDHFASLVTAGENDRPAGAAPMVDQVTDDPEDDTDMFGGEWIHEGARRQALHPDDDPSQGPGYLNDTPNLLGDPPGMDPEDYEDTDMFAPELPKQARKTAMPAPADLGVSIGSIFYSSWGYDQTNVNFYEVVGLTGASVKVREVAKTFVEQNGPGGNKVIPQVGNYIGGEMTKRLRDSGYADAAITINSSETAWLWDGTPKYETDSMYGH